MDDNAPGASGVVFACDAGGKVLEILRDDIGLGACLTDSPHFAGFLEPTSVNMGLAFLLEAKQHGVALGWTLQLKLDAETRLLSFSAVLSGDRLMVLGEARRPLPQDFTEGLGRVVSQRADAYRGLVKTSEAADCERPSLATASPPVGDVFDEMTALNSRLVNAERQLASKNAELARMSAAPSEELHLAQRILQFSGEAVIIADDQRHIIDVNSAYSTLTGFGREETLGQRLEFDDPAHESAEKRASIDRSLEESGLWQGECTGRRRDGQLFPKWLSVSVVPNASGETGHYVVNFADISRLKFVEQHWQRLAFYDILTKLPNRTLFQDRMTQAVARARREGDSLVLLFLDLDGFKAVNDRFGHDAGDGLLREAARRMEACTRETDTLYRLGGDEFTVIANGCDTDEQAGRLCEKLIDVLRVPFNLSGSDVRIGASIGVARFPMDGNDIQTLTKSADVAMYAAKAGGRNTSRFFSRIAKEKPDLPRAADA